MDGKGGRDQLEIKDTTMQGTLYKSINQCVHARPAAEQGPDLGLQFSLNHVQSCAHAIWC